MPVRCAVFASHALAGNSPQVQTALFGRDILCDATSYSPTGWTLRPGRVASSTRSLGARSAPGVVERVLARVRGSIGGLGCPSNV